MGHIYLVRHGQASFGQADYDNLSALGSQQGERLGAYFQRKGLRFNGALRGSLRRHKQTLDAIVRGAGAAPETLVWPGLNEYDSHALIGAIHPAPLPAPDTPELYRHHFRLLREALHQWIWGKSKPQGMPSYPDFVAGVMGAMDHIRSQCEGNILVVSSGGPISTIVSQLLGAPAETSVELNFRIRNTSVTELDFNPKRLALLTYNTLPHLDEADLQSWITYA
jgi:broad specificity phosphatase PhoE